MAVLGAVIGCQACSNSKSTVAPPACDRERLLALAARLDETPEKEQPDAVAAGLEQACGDALPRSIGWFLSRTHPSGPNSPDMMEPEAVVKAWMDRACPEQVWTAAHASASSSAEQPLAIYDACDFERYHVVKRADMKGLAGWRLEWGIHEWLLDQKIPAKRAASITRALLELEREFISAPIQMGEERERREGVDG